MRVVGRKSDATAMHNAWRSRLSSRQSKVDWRTFASFSRATDEVFYHEGDAFRFKSINSLMEGKTKRKKKNIYIVRTRKKNTFKIWI